MRITLGRKHKETTVGTHVLKQTAINAAALALNLWLAPSLVSLWVGIAIVTLALDLVLLSAYYVGVAQARDQWASRR